MDTSRVNVRTSDFDTVFFVRQAARSDSGEYELSVQIENMKDTATIRIRVVGARLEPPGDGMFERGRVKDGTEEGAQLFLCLPNVHGTLGSIPAFDK